MMLASRRSVCLACLALTQFGEIRPGFYECECECEFECEFECEGERLQTNDLSGSTRLLTPPARLSEQ